MIHLFNRANKFLVLDTGSGAVHVLDELTYRILENTPEKVFLDCNDIPKDILAKIAFNKDDCKTAYKELKSLVTMGLLYSDDSYSEFKSKIGESPIKAMCLHISHDCNLRCKYCFASTGNFGGERKLMDFKTAKKSIDLLVNLSGERHNLEVDFFGGEPLLAFDVVVQTVEYARSIEKIYDKNFRFTITTNGLTLDQNIIDYINKEMSNVVLSIDGRKEINDNLRPCPNGTGSYDIIMPKFQKLVSQRGEKEYYVRGTYTRDNLDFHNDVLALYNAGFDQISVEPVVGAETETYSIQEKNLAEISRSYEKLMNEMISRKKSKKNNFNFFHFMVDLDNGPCAIKRLRGCGSGNEYIAITPDGEIYPCHQFVGNNEFLMGDVEKGIQNLELKAKFANANIYNKPDCQKCWAKYFCSGGCNANNFNFNNSILKPHKLSCEIEKIRLECAIAIQATIKED